MGEANRQGHEMFLRQKNKQKQVLQWNISRRGSWQKELSARTSQSRETQWDSSATNLRQGRHHGCFPSHAVADENALLDAQLSEEMFQVFSHGFIGQHRAVGAVAMITGIYSQHLTGQRRVRALGVEWKEQRSGKQAVFSSWPQFKRAPAQRMHCARAELINQH